MSRSTCWKSDLKRTLPNKSPTRVNDNERQQVEEHDTFMANDDIDGRRSEEGERPLQAD